jgi:hypothetical protein
MPPDPPAVWPRNTTRGRPRVAGDFTCSRCRRSAGKHRATWPEGRICGTCFTQATHTYGICPGCGDHRLLPGPPNVSKGPTCADCADIAVDFRCPRCGREGEFHRRGICARCVLRQDLTDLLLTGASGTASAEPLMKLLETLCDSDRPESILSWKRSPRVHKLLKALGSGSIPLTHSGLDEHEPNRAVEHLRALLVHSGALPPREPYLAGFETWLRAKLASLPDPIAQPVERFATWHHLRRIRRLAEHRSVRGPVHSAKQEITETIKFLTWLYEAHGRTATTCTQQDVDAWLAAGPTTRTAIRTFFVEASKSRLNTAVKITHRAAKTTPSLTQDQRIAWIRELLTGTSESLPYRVAGMLLLLYAQPLVRIAAIRTDDLLETPPGLLIRLGKPPSAVPEAFAELIRAHAQARPNMRTATGSKSPWLFPGYRAGQHLHPDSIMGRLRDLGIDLHGARHRALTELVTQIPPPLVADTLGYSHQVAFKYAEATAQPWARYAAHRDS